MPTHAPSLFVVRAFGRVSQPVKLTACFSELLVNTVKAAWTDNR
jgi:hypothetical protein